MKKSPILIAAVLFTLSSVTPSHAFLDALIGSGGTKTKDNDTDLGLNEYTGIKHAIGVSKFDNASGFYSALSLGSNMGVMLESALIDSGRFVVVEPWCTGVCVGRTGSRNKWSGFWGEKSGSDR